MGGDHPGCKRLIHTRVEPRVQKESELKQTETLFDLNELEKKPRAPRQWRMHVIDAGCGYDDSENVRMQCSRCDLTTTWFLLRVSEAKRGIPCPKCNKLGSYIVCKQYGEYYPQLEEPDERYHRYESEE